MAIATVAHATDNSFLIAKNASFQAKSQELQKRIAEIEKIAGTSQNIDLGTRLLIKSYLLPPLKDGRETLVINSAKMTGALAPLGSDIQVASNIDICNGGDTAVVDAASTKQATTAGSLKQVDEVGVSLANGLKQISDPSKAAKVKWVLEQANPGNAKAGKKVDDGILAYKQLIWIHKEIRTYVDQQNTALLGYIGTNTAAAGHCGSIEVAAKPK